MVRKAETLKSVDELNVSARTRSILKKRFNSAEEIVRYGRCCDHGSNVSPKWEQELTIAIKEAGFIRPKTDFDMAFLLGSLYCRVFSKFYPVSWNHPTDVRRDIGKELFIRRIDQLSNEQYENFGVEVEDIEGVKDCLCESLTEREFDVICRHFGQNGAEIQTLNSIAQEYNLSDARIQQIENKALRMLSWCYNWGLNPLPAILETPTKVICAIKDLKDKLFELYEEPDVKREHELLLDLWSIKEDLFKSPYWRGSHPSTFEIPARMVHAIDGVKFKLSSLHERPAVRKERLLFTALWFMNALPYKSSLNVGEWLDLRFAPIEILTQSSRVYKLNGIGVYTIPEYVLYPQVELPSEYQEKDLYTRVKEVERSWNKLDTRILKY